MANIAVAKLPGHSDAITERCAATMKNFKKGYDPNDIIEYAKTLEPDNSDDIYIWFIGTNCPVVFGRSALCLESYFPEMETQDNLSSGGVKTLVGHITFPFHRVLDMFCLYNQQVDDHCLHIIGVNILPSH